jgi:hypothetical protein
MRIPSQRTPYDRSGQRPAYPRTDPLEAVSSWDLQVAARLVWSIPTQLRRRSHPNPGTCGTTEKPAVGADYATTTVGPQLCGPHPPRLPRPDATSRSPAARVILLCHARQAATIWHIGRAELGCDGLLREALGHGYDSDRLRQNPLTKLAGLSDQPDAKEALRRLVTGAVESLRPPRGVSGALTQLALLRGGVPPVRAAARPALRGRSAGLARTSPAPGAGRHADLHGRPTIAA